MKDYEKIQELIREGHSEHCAKRQVWGDGKCECAEYEKEYAQYKGRNFATDIQKG